MMPKNIWRELRRRKIGIEPYSTLAGAITIKSYSMTLKANNYVPPFSMFGDGRIPDDDIKKYGTPIAISAIQKS